jgi:hypothetical protein
MADERTPGRPPKFATVEELEEKINAYFDTCFEESWYKDKDGIWQPDLDRFGEVIRHQVKPFTMSGLALALDTTRETLLDYSVKDGYSDSIRRAKQRCEEFAESLTLDKGNRNAAGAIFNLKNNYARWSDKQEIEHSGETGVKIVNDIPRKPD